MSDDLEQRLRDSLRAYAETVAAPEDGAPTAHPAESRPVVRRWRGALLAAAAAAAVVIGSLVVIHARDPGAEPVSGLAAGSSVPRTGGTPAEAPESAGGTASDQALSAPAGGQALPASPEPGVAYPVDLYTHCGVRGLDINGVWFAADPPLVEDGGNPPAGWGNPDQPGTLTMLSATQAVFADAAGHEIRLRADESARPPLCA